jgi:hypothetical protein
MKRAKTKPPEYSSGPTAERIAMAQGGFVVGDDQQGTKVYHFQDTPLARLYKRLAKADKSDGERKQLTAEHVALMKYRHHWHCAGLEASVGSVDLNRVFSSDPSNFSGMAKTEAQVSHRQMYRRAVALVGHESSILLDNFVCYEWDRGIASGLSYYKFRKAIRNAAARLSDHWNT